MKKIIVLCSFVALTCTLSAQGSINFGINADANQIFNKIFNSLGINDVAIANKSGKDVRFYVYNYSDIFYAVPAQELTVARGWSGEVSASGRSFKIRPNNQANAEFTVTVGKAYIYYGVGKVESRAKK